MPKGFLGQIERAVGVPENVVEIREEIGLVCEVLVDTHGGLIEHGSDGSVGACCRALVVPARVRGPEDLLEKASDGFGPLGLLLGLHSSDLGAVAFVLRLRALPESSSQSAQNRQHNQRGGRHPSAVPADEAPHSVPDRCRASFDGETLEVAREIHRQRVGRRIATGPDLGRAP